VAQPNESNRVFEFGSFRLDAANRVLRRGSSVVPLTPKALDVLLVLVQSSGRVVDKEELLRRVWPETFVEEGILSVNVAAIRKALSDGEAGPAYIETAPRRGYRFVAEVREVSEQPASRRRIPWLAGGAAALVLAGLAAWKWIPWAAPAGPLRAVPLTSYQGSEMSPSFSPDGSQVAFSWNGENRDNYDIYVQVIGSGPPLRLTRDAADEVSPAWSPDGNRIAFIRAGAIYLISPLGGPERKLAELDAGHLAWTPDGSAIATNVNRRGIVLVSTADGATRVLTSPPASVIMGDLSFAFSPDGKKLAFARFGSAPVSDLHVMENPLTPNPSPPRRIASEGLGIYGITWTPDSREIIYASGRMQYMAGLHRIAVSGPSPVPRKIAEAGDGVAEPAIWSGSSRIAARIAFERRMFDENIWRMDSTDFSGSSRRRIVASTRIDRNPQFSPDGRRLAFVSDRSGVFEIWVSDADGSSPIQLTSFRNSQELVNAPRWSPDGKSIAFSGTQNRNRDIFDIAAGGGAPRRLTAQPSEEGRPSWSRDGRWIYFYSTRSGTMEIWKAPAQGGSALQVTQGGGHEGFESPDGKLFYFLRPFGLGLRSLPVNAGAQPGEPVRGMETVREGLWAMADGGIYFVDMAQTFTNDGRYDPRAVVMEWTAWSRRSVQPVRFLEFATHRISTVGTITENQVLNSPAFHVTGDGRSFVWSQVDFAQSDLMLMENFR
jgi:Tol biopolymer transport system component/DNA-binding winged helix-turn-helix (wHTH) protein